MKSNDHAAQGKRILTVHIGRHYFGIAIDEIHDVIRQQETTYVPHVQDSVVGLLNLRGHIVTEINIAGLLALRVDAQDPVPRRKYAVVVLHNGDHYSFVFDGIGDVVDASPQMIEPLPPTVDRALAAVAKGVLRVDDKLLVYLDLPLMIAQLTHNAQQQTA